MYTRNTPFLSWILCKGSTLEKFVNYGTTPCSEHDDNENFRQITALISMLSLFGTKSQLLLLNETSHVRVNYALPSASGIFSN